MLSYGTIPLCPPTGKFGNIFLVLMVTVFFAASNNTVACHYPHLCLSLQESVRGQVGSYKFIHARNVQRPQLKFKDQVDNSNNPFIPLIRCKPNAKKALPESKSLSVWCHHVTFHMTVA